MSSGSSVPTFRDHLSVTPARVKKSKYIGCPETSAQNCDSTLYRSHLQGSRSPRRLVVPKRRYRTATRRYIGPIFKGQEVQVYWLSRNVGTELPLDAVSVPSSRVKNSKYIGCPETSVQNCHSTLYRSHLQESRSPKRLVVPKRRYITTTQRCLISQKSADLNFNPDLFVGGSGFYTVC
jgi:hypothetical protein